MIEIVATVSSKHQVTIPADVRRRLGIGAADKVAFVLKDNETVELRPVAYDLESILGSLDPLPGGSVDFDREIAEAIEEDLASRPKFRP